MALTIGTVVTHVGDAVVEITGTPLQDAELTVTLSAAYLAAYEKVYVYFVVNGDTFIDHEIDVSSTPFSGSIALAALDSRMAGLTLTVTSGTFYSSDPGAANWYTFTTVGTVWTDSPTFEDLILQVRERSDTVNSEFVSDDEIRRYLDQSMYELYDLLIQKYGNDYYISSHDITTDGTDGGEFDLPADFYKLRGVDLSLPAAGTNGWVTLRPFMFGERNRFVYPNTQVTFGLMGNLRYHIQGDKIRFTPTPAAGQTIRIWYVPQLSEVEASVPGDVVPLGTYENSSKWLLTVTGTCQFPHDVVMTMYTVSDTPYVKFDIDRGSVIANSSALTVAEGTEIDLGTVSTLLSGLTLTLKTIYSTMSSDNMKTVAWRWNTGNPNAVVDNKIRHWLEYVVIDSAIKCMVKEESDPSALMAQKVVAVQRLESAAENRDAGFPMTVTDVTKRDGGWGGGMNDGGLGGPF